jgi:diguanylate cyclase
MHDWKRMDRARTLHDRAYALMQAHDIAPTPVNYELCFHYEGGTKELLQPLFEEVLRAGQATDPTVTEGLHDRLFRQTQAAAVGDVATGLQLELEKIASLLKATGGGTADYSRTLDIATLQASHLESSPQLRELLDSVSSATQLMSENVRQLEARVAQSTVEVESMRAKIDVARRESLTDALTGLANRRLFDETLASVVAGVDPQGTSVCVLMCDIDHFKTFNDTWGHATGDQVLRLVANCVKSSVRRRDTAARFGGEEFVVILPQTTMADAINVAEQIRKTVQSRKIVKKHSGESLGSITLSIGVSERTPGDTAATLLARADTCLYAAKHAGRNRVSSEVPEETATHASHGSTSAAGGAVQQTGNSIMELNFNDDQTEIFVDPAVTPADERLQRLLAWWRRSDTAGKTRWRDDLLSELTYLRDDLHLYTVIDDGAGFRVKWVGAGLVKRLGGDPTGLSITSTPVPSNPLAPSMLRMFELSRLTTTMKSPIRTFSKTSHNLAGGRFRGESLCLPFGDDRGTVEHILSATVLTAV